MGARWILLTVIAVVVVSSAAVLTARLLHTPATEIQPAAPTVAEGTTASPEERAEFVAFAQDYETATAAAEAVPRVTAIHNLGGTGEVEIHTDLPSSEAPRANELGSAIVSCAYDFFDLEDQHTVVYAANGEPIAGG
ncbi:hypothetical protein RIF23_19805 [Lipingzhangella sp. LS1_29]|uniref:Uncharacterized protein n=1 Tax=Lipingzhangella rawalii TaxID=2055835 RepID=A0ABU2HBA1_9ACTN|nr:hypothetical protein [Lipingzhangella rawalii]MDS1272538.1 hypothetical protein [Lipingzhangella rawalii]